MFEGELGGAGLDVDGEAAEGEIGDDVAVERLNYGVGGLVGHGGADDYHDANGEQVVEGREAGVLLNYITYGFED